MIRNEFFENEGSDERDNYNGQRRNRLLGVAPSPPWRSNHIDFDFPVETPRDRKNFGYRFTFLFFHFFFI